MLQETPDHKAHITQQIADYSLRFPDESPMIALFTELLEEWPHCLTRERLEGHLTASALVTCSDQILLVHHRKLGIWLQPGGHADGDPDLLGVSLKEVQEETGICPDRPANPRILDIDRHRIPEHRGVPPHYHYDIRYWLPVGSADLPVVSEESHDVRWVRRDLVADYTDEESLYRMIRKTN